MFHWFKKHNSEGLETPDSTPLEVTLKTIPPLTLQQQIERFVRAPDLQALARSRGFDTFDEAEDFGEIDPGMDGLYSPYEDKFDPNGIPHPHIQTRLDEQKHGLVEQLPPARVVKANQYIRGLKRKPEPLKPSPKDAVVEPDGSKTI